LKRGLTLLQVLGPFLLDPEVGDERLEDGVSVIGGEVSGAHTPKGPPRRGRLRDLDSLPLLSNYNNKPLGVYSKSKKRETQAIQVWVK